MGVNVLALWFNIFIGHGREYVDVRGHVREYDHTVAL